VAVSACTKEWCTVVGGGGTTLADEIGEAEGAVSSACQSNGMAAAVRRKKAQVQIAETRVRNYGQHVVQPL